MPKIVLTHAVKDVAHWASKHDERVDLFAPFASQLTDYVPAEGGDVVAVSVTVHDMDGLQTMLGTSEAQAAKESHGVIDPISLFVQSG